MIYLHWALRRFICSAKPMHLFCACADGQSEHDRLEPTSSLIHTSSDVLFTISGGPL